MIKLKNILDEKLDKKTLRKIKSDDRIVLSPGGLRTFNNVKQLKGGDVKPLGLWYAFGKDWYNAAQRMQFSVDEYNYIYKLDLNINKIAVVTNKNFDEFTNKNNKKDTISLELYMNCCNLSINNIIYFNKI